MEPPANVAPNERYRFLGKDQGIVEDTRTKLEWQRCSLGQTWTGATCAGEATKYKWNEAQRIAPAGWRLPTKDELASLVYCSSGQPAYWKTAPQNVQRRLRSTYALDRGLSQHAQKIGFGPPRPTHTIQTTPGASASAMATSAMASVRGTAAMCGSCAVESPHLIPGNLNLRHPATPSRPGQYARAISFSVGGEKVPLYFAAELAPTANIPPEAPLCYMFMVAGPKSN